MKTQARAKAIAGTGLLLAFWAVSAAVGEERTGQVLGRETVEPLARVGEETITAERFVEEMRQRGGNLPGQYVTIEQRRALLDEILKREALIQAARRAGYYRDPEVVAVMERAMLRKFFDDSVGDRLAETSVSNEEIEEFYELHRDEYARPARVQGAMVFIGVPEKASEEKRRELREKAHRALEEAQKLDPSIRHFGPVAQRYSEDRATRYTGGSTGWMVIHPGRQYRWEAEVVDAIFSLTEPGELGPIVETDSGFYLIRLVDREEAEPRPLEPLRDGIRQRLTQDRRMEIRDQFYREALAAVEVEVDEALLQSIESPAPPVTPQVPPPLPSTQGSRPPGDPASQ